MASTAVTAVALCEPCKSAVCAVGAGDAGGCELCTLREKVATQAALIEELQSKPDPDVRAHCVLIGDNQLVKMRRPPHYMGDYLGSRTPRMLPRWQANQGLDGMLAYLIAGLDNDKAAGRHFHVLWFGGLHDTTQEDYDRAAYVAKLQAALEKAKEHPRVLSVSWATLPESAQNVEAGQINEKVVSWATECGGWLKVVDLRYISRREGTMEASEAMWNPKGSQCVCESVKKFLTEKLEYGEDEIKALEDSARRHKEFREKREKRKGGRVVIKTTAAVGGVAAVKTNGAAAAVKPKTAASPAQAAAKTVLKKAATAGGAVLQKKYPPVQIKSKIGGAAVKNGPKVQKIQQLKTGAAVQHQQLKPMKKQFLQNGNGYAAQKRAFPSNAAQQQPQWAAPAAQHQQPMKKRQRQDNGGYQQQQGYQQSAYVNQPGYQQQQQGYQQGYNVNKYNKQTGYNNGYSNYQTNGYH